MKSKILLTLLFAFMIFMLPLIAVAVSQPGVFFAAMNATPSTSSNISALLPWGKKDDEAPGLSSLASSPPASQDENSAGISQTDGAQPSVAATAGTKKRENVKAPVFKILDLSTKKILEVPAYDYVVGAVASEMPATYHEEALKAQAVAAYTYALYQRNVNARVKPAELKGADFSADPTHYLGFMTEEIARERFSGKFDEYYAKITAAVDAVFGEAALYDGAPIVAAYHAISSGVTESAQNVWQDSLPYLMPVDSEGDILAGSYESTLTLTESQVSKTLTKTYPGIDLPEKRSAWFNILKRSQSNTVLEVKVGDKTLTGADIRKLFNLRSACFEVVYNDSSFTFTVKGYGHDVGLSQNGADFLARQGKSYQDILKHYYTGIKIEPFNAV